MVEAATAPHILLVSFPAQGHVNPLLRLAKRLASKGLFITFSSSVFIGRRILSSSSKTPAASSTPIPVGRGHIRFEFFPDGFPDGDDPRREDLDLLTHNLRTVCAPELSALIRRLKDEGRPVSCVVNNPFVPWALDVAEELGIPSAVLWVQSAAVFSAYYHYVHSLVEFPSVENPDVAVSLPGWPTLKLDELPTFMLPSSPYKPLTEVILSQFRNIHKATWVLLNSFQELEHDAIKSLSDKLPLIPVGPLVDDNSNSEIKGDLWKSADDCIQWLDLQKPSSVVYVSLGSVVKLTETEMTEMANGLLNCGRPFLWVVRDDSRKLLPAEFMERVKDSSGMLVSWSPQEKVLSHTSSGCFLTHCGWNSTLEALTAGVPVVAFPQWGDQVPDAKFLVDVYGVGVRLETPVTREGMQRSVEAVMAGEGAERMRERAAEWGRAARAAVEEGGSSDRNLEGFMNEIERRAYVGHESLM